MNVAEWPSFVLWAYFSLFFVFAFFSLRFTTQTASLFLLLRAVPIPLLVPSFKRSSSCPLAVTFACMHPQYYHEASLLAAHHGFPAPAMMTSSTDDDVSSNNGGPDAAAASAASAALKSATVRKDTGRRAKHFFTLHAPPTRAC